MLVVVVSVDSVPVSVVEVIDMIPVLDSLVAAGLAMLMVGHGMLGYGLVLVVVISVQGMAVGSMDVIDVVTVPDGIVSAPLTVLVFLNGVFCMNVIGAHEQTLSSRTSTYCPPTITPPRRSREPARGHERAHRRRRG